MDDDKIFYAATTALFPPSFIVEMQRRFIVWAFGPEYFTNAFEPGKLIDLWNERHGETWMISQEESGETNLDAIELMWETELMAMLYNYFDISPTIQEEN